MVALALAVVAVVVQPSLGVLASGIRPVTTAAVGANKIIDETPSWLPTSVSSSPSLVEVTETIVVTITLYQCGLPLSATTSIFATPPGPDSITDHFSPTLSSASQVALPVIKEIPDAIFVHVDEQGSTSFLNGPIPSGADVVFASQPLVIVVTPLPETATPPIPASAGMPTPNHAAMAPSNGVQSSDISRIDSINDARTSVSSTRSDFDSEVLRSSDYQASKATIRSQETALSSAWTATTPAIPTASRNHTSSLSAMESNTLEAYSERSQTLVASAITGIHNASSTHVHSPKSVSQATLLTTIRNVTSASTVPTSQTPYQDSSAAASSRIVAASLRNTTLVDGQRVSLTSFRATSTGETTPSITSQSAMSTAANTVPVSATWSSAKRPGAAVPSRVWHVPKWHGNSYVNISQPDTVQQVSVITPSDDV